MFSFYSKLFGYLLLMVLFFLPFGPFKEFPISLEKFDYLKKYYSLTLYYHVKICQNRFTFLGLCRNEIIVGCLKGQQMYFLESRTEL